MNEITLRLTMPKRLNPSVRRILASMDLDWKGAVWLDLHRPKNFIPEPSECHINVLVQIKYKSGILVPGWVIWEDRINEFVEAQFHSVWRDQHGNVKDITPRQDREKKVLFVPDKTRRFQLMQVEGSPAVLVYETVRMHRGLLLNGPSERVHVCVTNLIYLHGLASSSASAA